MGLGKIIFGSIFGLLITYVVYTLVYTGAFKDVEISRVDGPEFHLFYKEHVGSYHKIDEVIVATEEWLATKNIGCRRSFGHFLDNPEIVDQDRLRSHAGCILNNKAVDPPEGFFYKKIEPQKWVKADFDGSPALGPLKIYPRIEEYMEENRLKRNGPILEVYTKTGQEQLTTEFYFPL